MISYLPMVNAWSLAWETLFGDMDKEYPIIDTNNVGAGNTASQDPIMIKVIIKMMVLIMKLV